MSNSAFKIIDMLVTYLDKLKNELETDLQLENSTVKISAIPQMLDVVCGVLPEDVLISYSEFFGVSKKFFGSCQDACFLNDHLQDSYDAIVLLIQQLSNIDKIMKNYRAKCPCCGSKVQYLPLDSYYQEMKEKHGVLRESNPETLNRDRYFCPECHSSDRDRLIVSFMKKIRLPEAPEGTRVLQIAPSDVIDKWIQMWCPNVTCETTDLFMDGVTFKSDIQNMNTVSNETYDVIICSHVLEHVRDDRKALSELHRILKDDGEIIFLVPIDLNCDEIDEEWGLSEEENWRRFGQGDHCRLYSKAGLVERLEEHFCVHQLTKDYFGNETFEDCGLIETSTLYVLTKNDNVVLEKGWTPDVDENLCENGPLVSVILPTYNHENYVARAVESVINQSYKNIEILVADDGSTDRTVDVLRKYSGYFSKEYYFDNNQRGRAMFLARQATGKYIALMHSDDYWEPDKIAIQVKELEEKGGISLTWANYITDDGELIEDATFIEKNRSRIEWLRYLWDNGNCFCNPSCVMSRELYLNAQKHGESSKQLPDYFKWIDFLQYTDINIVQHPLTKMGIHYNGKNANDSAPTKENRYRHVLEDGIHWMSVLNDMKDDLFISVFGDCFKGKDANSEEELMCEKYFLMIDSGKIGRENAAINYMAVNYTILKDCLREKYNYTKNNFVEDEINKGFLAEFLRDGIKHQ